MFEFIMEKPMKGISLLVEDYKATKLDKIKDAFRCPDGKGIMLAYWDDDFPNVLINFFESFDIDCCAWENYALIPGATIPDEWRTYDELECSNSNILDKILLKQVGH